MRQLVHNSTHNNSVGILKGLSSVGIFFMGILILLANAPVRAQTTTFNYSGTIANYTVPAGVTFIRVLTKGASGGGNGFGGSGAIIQGDITVTPGQVLKVLVGQSGGTGVESGFPNRRGGGGGGSFVTTIANAPLVIAGGGGGAGVFNTPGQTGQTGTSGGTQSTHGEVGGTGGNGGNVGYNGAGCGGPGYGGGGLLTNGGGTLGGISFVNGGASVDAVGCLSISSLGRGGFGGGGAGGNGGGGGGGYSGGAGGSSDGIFPGGGGGGSYNSGINQSNTTGNVGDGQVVITVLNTVPTFVNGPTQNLAVCQNSAALSINSQMKISDLEIGQTETWTIISGPTHGSLGGFPYATASTGSTITPAGMTYTPTALYAGTDVFTIQISDGIATSTTTVNVTVNPTPSPLAAGNICVGGTPTLTNTAAGGTWTSSNTGVATIGAGTGTITGIAPGTTTITYTMPCGSFVSTTYTVYAKPVAAPVNDGPICVGGIANLTANPSGGVGAYSYSWSAPGLFTSTAANPVVNPGTSTTYSLTVSNASPGCTSVVYPTTVTVNAKPSAVPTNDGPICIGGTVNLTANATGGVGAYSYSWSGANLSSTTIANPSATPTATATYSLLVSNAASGCSSGISYTTSATVNPKPVAAPSNDGTICIGGTVNLAANASGGVGAYLYTWSGPSLSSTAIANPTATPTATATYAVVVSNAASGCSSGIAYNTLVTVNAKPTAFPTNDGPICIGGTVNLSANPSNGVGAYIYNWSGANLSSTIAANPSATPTITGTYSLTVSNAASGCSSGIIYTTGVTVNPKPTLAPSNDGPICIDGTVNLAANAAGGVGAYIYNWSGPFLSSTGVANPSATPTVTSTYSVTVSNTASGCSSGIVYNTTATVNAKPTAAPVNDGAICVGGTLNLTANAADGVGAYIYNWSGADLMSTTAANPTAIPSATGTFTYSLTVSNAASGCSSGIVYTTDATINAKPSASPMNDGAICVGGTVNITANPAGGVGAYMYNWSGPFLSSTTVDNPTAMPTTPSFYTLIVSNTASGCMSIPYSTLVTVNPKPTLAPSNDGPICIDGTVHLMANAADGVGTYIYNWSGTDLSSSTMANPTATPTATATYSVEVSNAASGCSSGIVYTNTVTVNAKPVAAPANDGPICQGNYVNLTSNASGGVGAYIYNWSGSALWTTSTANPSASPTGNSTYSLTVSNAASGCNSGIVYTTSVHVDTLYSPVVTITGLSSIKFGQNDTLTAVVTQGGPGVTYQWVVNGTYIAGATNSKYISSTLRNNDNVNCQVTSHSPCGSLTNGNSMVITINNVGVQQVVSSIGNISLVPNPNKGIFSLDGQLNIVGDQDVTISITNMLGQTVYTDKTMTQGNELHKAVQLNGTLANGNYLLNLRIGGESKTFHFVLEQ
jgi:trimeric autotransporter adhesin